MLTQIPAFIGGRVLTHYSQGCRRLLAGNSEGIIKIFDTSQPDLEPQALDIPENLTALDSHERKILVAATDGSLSILAIPENITGNEKYQEIFKGSRPLRDAAFINGGKRVIAGGDSNQMVIVDLENENSVSSVDVDAAVVHVSHNGAGEVVSIGFADGSVRFYSVVNEALEHVKTIPDVLKPFKFTSNEVIDYNGAHSHEYAASKSSWSPNGELLYAASADGSIVAVERTNWETEAEYIPETTEVVSFSQSQLGKHLAVLLKNGKVNVFEATSERLVKSVVLDKLNDLPIGVTWHRNTLYVGTNNGELHTVEVSIDNSDDTNVNHLFVDEAEEESNTEDMEVEESPREVPTRRFIEDDLIVDEDEDGYYNQDVDTYLAKRKRPRTLTPLATTQVARREDIAPFSPGSTPWVKSVNNATSSTLRRYLVMNAIGYSWSVKTSTGETSDNLSSLTVSFFDRGLNKDYHFIDDHGYDLSSLNERGLLLCCSGYKVKGPNRGRIFYRHHTTTNDSWDRHVPLMDNEYITSACLTSKTDATLGESIIIVGTNYGYLRFFNLYGLCINIIKTAPVLSVISSALSTVLVLHSGSAGHAYSLISVDEDYRFLQQDRALPLRTPSDKSPMIKGLFFNENSDPCLVSGYDDTLSVLLQWREPANARWVPILDCKNAVTDHGLTDLKSSWKAWPLGLNDDKFSFLILKNNDEYPGFPLPLPVELEVRMPVKSFAHLKAQQTEDEKTLVAMAKEDDPEEQFLRASTLGKLLSGALADLGEEDEVVERLGEYSVAFDKALLKVFAKACQSSRLNQAFSTVRLIKNDKALLAASKIAQRYEFANLANKINTLREDLIDLKEDS